MGRTHYNKYCYYTDKFDCAECCPFLRSNGRNFAIINCMKTIDHYNRRLSFKIMSNSQQIYPRYLVTHNSHCHIISVLCK